MVKEGLLMVSIAWWGRHPPWLLAPISEGGACHCIGTGGDVSGMRGRGNKAACGIYTAPYCLWGCRRCKQGGVWDSHCPVSLTSPFSLEQCCRRTRWCQQGMWDDSALCWCLHSYMCSSSLPSALSPPHSLLLADSACWLCLQAPCDAVGQCGHVMLCMMWWKPRGGGVMEHHWWCCGRWNWPQEVSCSFPSCCLSADRSRIQTLAHSLQVGRGAHGAVMFVHVVKSKCCKHL